MRQLTLKRWCIGLLTAVASLAAQAGTVTYFHNDLAGSPQSATNASGQVIWRESYRPYGERLTNSASAADNKVWFTSRRQDVDTGLVYMGARYYDPAIGRFVSMDPVGFDEQNLHSHNRYAYANNNPNRYKDPTGGVVETISDVVSFTISVAMFRAEPTLGNFTGAAFDGIALAIPFMPGGVGIVRAASNGIDASRAADLVLGAERAGAALKDDAAHRAASFLSKEQLAAGRAFAIRGGDGVERTLLQSPGGMNDKNGIFEYIIGASGKIEHQRFIEGGIVTGRPNQAIKKAVD